MLTIRNITNAFVKIQSGDTVFIADPWITDGIYDGGWSPYPPVQDPETALNQCHYLYISHIHQDHFDLNAIARLPRDCEIVIPDRFPNDLIRRRLEELGFEHIIMCEPLKPLVLTPDLVVEIIPPLNRFGQEQKLYGQEFEALAVDSAMMVTWEGTKIILMNDNSPYDLSPLYDHLERFSDPDLLAINYNGASDDYPVCYRGLSTDEKITISNIRDARKLEKNIQLIQMLRPRAVMVYSSEFSVRGRQAKAFAAVKRGLYNEKTLMAAHLADVVGLPVFALYEHDLLELSPGGSQKIAGGFQYPPLDKRAEQLWTDEPNYDGRFPDGGDLSVIRKDARPAADHMFRYMDKYGWSSRWIVEVHLAEDRTPLCIDLGRREVLDRAAPRGRKVLRCFLDASYFSALLNRLTHWNNAMISYNLEWERIPNEYDPFLYKSLNFFHM